MKKRMLRRIISVLSCVVFVGTLFTGCGSSESGGAKGAKILFIETDDEDTFRASLTEAIMSSASTYGVTIDEVLTLLRVIPVSFAVWRMWQPHCRLKTPAVFRLFL